MLTVEVEHVVAARLVGIVLADRLQQAVTVDGEDVVCHGHVGAVAQKDVEHGRCTGNVVDAPVVLTRERVARSVVDAVAIVPLVDAEAEGTVFASRVLVIALQQVDVQLQVFFHPHRGKQRSLRGLQPAVVDLRRDVVVQREVVELVATACNHFPVPCAGSPDTEQAQAGVDTLEHLAPHGQLLGIVLSRLSLMYAYT